MARPKSNEARKVQLNVRVPPDVMAEIHVRAKAEGRSLSGMGLRLIRLGMAQELRAVRGDKR
jgi:predicted HicB family RNase H-like nuclease